MEQETNVLNAFKTLLAPLIKEVVLTTIEEHQQTQQKKIAEVANVTPDEAARQLNVTKTTLWRWNNIGYLKNERIGRKSYYRQSDIDAIKNGTH